MEAYRFEDRVVPDTTGFKKRLEAELGSIKDITVKVTLDLDRSKFDAAMEKLRSENIRVPAQVDLDTDKIGKTLAGKKVTIPAEVDIDQAKLRAELSSLNAVKIKADIADLEAKIAVSAAKLKELSGEKTTIQIKADIARLNASVAAAQVKLAELRDKKVKIEAQVNIDQDALGRALASRKIHIKAVVDVDRDPFKAMLAGIASDVTSGLGSAFSKVGSLGSSAFGLVESSAGSASDAISEASGAVGGVVKAGLALEKVAALGTAVAEAGAGITVAFGAASTAIAAVPAAIGLIAVPMAAVTLGMDGIKKAAKSIEPQFKSLKKTISDTFEKGLTPVLKTIGNELFPKLAVGLSATATSLSTVATSLGDFITRGAGLGLLSTAIGNVNQGILAMQPGLLAGTEGFLRLAGSSGAMNVLTTAVNGAGEALKSISLNPSLEKAFQGLSGVVGSLETAFTGLVNNGIELFAAAAPGAQTAIDGIGSFFSKFNWTRLGAAAGSALRGLGDSLSSIPPATVEKITTSFEGLGAELNSPEFKAGMQGFADATPLLVGSLQLMAKEFAAAGKDVGDFARDLTALGTGSAFVDLGSQLGQLSDKLGLTTDAQQRFLDKVNEKPSAPLAPEVVAKSFEGLTPILNGSMLGAQNALKTGLAPLPGLALAGFAAITPAAQGGLNPLINTVRVAADQSSAAFEQGFANLPQVTAKQLNAADAQVQRVLGPGGTMVAGFGTGMRQLSPIMQQELGLLGPQVDTSLAPLPVSVTTATQAMADAANAAIPGLGTAFQTGFAALGPLIDTAFLALNTANIPLALTAMGTAITTGLTTLVGPAFTLGFQTLGPILDQAFLLLSTTNITAGLTAMGTAITTGFATLLGPAFTLGFATLGPILDAAFLLLSTTNITAGMTAIGLAVTTGLTTLVGPAFTTGFAALGATAVTPGMVAVAAAVTAGFAQVVAAVTAGMAQANAAAGTGFTQLVQVATDSGNQVVQVITDAMAKFVQAVTDGGAKAVEALKQVGEQMKSAIDVNILVPVGEQISAGLARGIANGGSAVTAAAVKVVRDAAAAANNAAQVKSPSRLTMPTGRGMSQGIEVGLLTGGADVVAAAEKVVRDALAVMDASTFSSGSFAGDLGARLSSAVFASAGDFTNSPVIAFSHTTVLDGDVVEQSVKRVTASETRNLRQRMKAG